MRIASCLKFDGVTDFRRSRSVQAGKTIVWVIIKQRVHDLGRKRNIFVCAGGDGLVMPENPQEEERVSYCQRPMASRMGKSNNERASRGRFCCFQRTTQQR
jgi:hypothetical protein